MKRLLIILCSICSPVFAEPIVDTSLMTVENGLELVAQRDKEFPLVVPTRIVKSGDNTLTVEGAGPDKGIVFQKMEGSGNVSLAFQWSPFAVSDDPILEVVLRMEMESGANAGNLMFALKSKDQMLGYLQIGGDGGIGLNDTSMPDGPTQRITTLTRDQREVELKIQMNYETGETRVFIDGAENDTVVKFDNARRVDQLLIFCPHEKARWTVKFKKIAVNTVQP